jgi:hypothetical protein
MKKGQLIPIVFIVFVVFIVAIGFILFNIFYGKEYEEKVFEIRTLDLIRNLIEDLRNYLKLSLTYSSQQALRENAGSGGSIGAGAWICNGPNPLPPDLSKKCLEKYTNYYLNIYLGNFTTALPLKIIAKNFESVSYGVDLNKVLQPSPFDEGNFWVNSSKIDVIVSSKDKQLVEQMNITEFVTKNRFWYMLRIFTEWTNEDPLSDCICANIGCACGSTSEMESCSIKCMKAAESCSNIALIKLQKKFDQYVKCEKAIGCCRQGKGDDCQKPRPFPCEGWPGCSLKCEHSCTESTFRISYSQQEYKEISQLSSPFQIQSYQLSGGLKFSSSLNCKAEYWYEARFGASFSFTCRDYKYYVSSPKGPQPLTFSVLAFASFRDRDACYSLVDCYCPPNVQSCDECKPTGLSCESCKPA